MMIEEIGIQQLPIDAELCCAIERRRMGGREEVSR